MNIKPFFLAGITFAATAATIVTIARAAPALTPRETEDAKQIFGRCIECHANKRKPQIRPERYTDEKWAGWYAKMKVKAKLTPNEDKLMSRYFGEIRSTARQPNNPAPPQLAPPPATPAPQPPPPVASIPPPTPAPRKPYFGLILRDLGESAAGVSVVGVSDDSPATAAGLDAGDMIVSFNGQAVRTAKELQSLFDAATPDAEVGLDISRDGKSLTIKVKVGAKP